MSRASVMSSTRVATGGGSCVTLITVPAGGRSAHRYAPPVSRRRLDALLAERGLFDSRSRAAAAVLAGDVRLGDQGPLAEKPGQLVPEDAPLAVEGPPPYVSRGGIKLQNALDAFGVDP